MNIVLGAAKFAAGILGHSQALIAAATESFADIFNSLIVWGGIVVAEAPADKDHPYGHGKAEPLAAAFGAAMLLLGAVWISAKALNDIAALGVRRVSVGGGLARAAWGGFMRAAKAIAEQGVFDGFAGAASGAELNGLFR